MVRRATPSLQTALLVGVAVVLLVEATPLVGVAASTPVDANTDTDIDADVDTNALLPPSDQHAPRAASANVSSTLLQLVHADDRAAYAATHGITLDGDRAVVVVELHGGSTVPDGYDITVQQSATVGGQTVVQALVPVDRIVPLAEEPSVAYVRLPETADAGGQKTRASGDEVDDSTAAPEDRSPTRRTDVLLFVGVIGLAAVAVGVYGSVRR